MCLSAVIIWRLTVKSRLYIFVGAYSMVRLWNMPPVEFIWDISIFMWFSLALKFTILLLISVFTAHDTQVGIGIHLCVVVFFNGKKGQM